MTNYEENSGNDYTSVESDADTSVASAMIGRSVGKRGWSGLNFFTLNQKVKSVKIHMVME